MRSEDRLVENFRYPPRPSCYGRYPELYEYRSGLIGWRRLMPPSLQANSNDYWRNTLSKYRVKDASDLNQTPHSVNLCSKVTTKKENAWIHIVWSIGVTLSLWECLSTPNVQLSTHNVVKEVGQIWCEIRIQKDFDGTLSIFTPLSTPNQFPKVTALVWSFMYMLNIQLYSIWTFGYSNIQP